MQILKMDRKNYSRYEMGDNGEKGKIYWRHRIEGKERQRVINKDLENAEYWKGTLRNTCGIGENGRRGRRCRRNKRNTRERERDLKHAEYWKGRKWKKKHGIGENERKEKTNWREMKERKRR